MENFNNFCEKKNLHGQLYDMITGNDYDLSIMEWVEGGSLDDRLMQLQSTKLF